MKRAAPNLFEFKPARAVGFETGADGLTTLLVPRFTNRLLVRFLVPRLRSPVFRVRFDAIGSFVWQQCDGTVSVADIAARACAQFGGDAEAMLHRVGKFLVRLDRERCVTMRAAGAAAVAAAP